MQTALLFTYIMVLQPGAGYIDGTFPVTVGSEEVTIPEMPVRFPPLFPGLINGPGRPFAATGLSGPNTAGNALFISAVLPETAINLPESVSSASGIFDVVLNPGIDLKIDPFSFV